MAAARSTTLFYDTTGFRVRARCRISRRPGASHPSARGAITRMLRLFDGVAGNVKLRLQPPYRLAEPPALGISKVRLFLPRDDSSLAVLGGQEADDTRLFSWNASAGDQDSAYLWARDSQNNLTAPIPVALK